MWDPTIQAAGQGLLLVCSWPNIVYPFVATLLTMVVAFVPGISGATLMALTIPFTLTLGPVPTVLILGGMVGGSTFMGSVTAIIFNIPGSGPSAATLLDGHPMAQQGRAKTALGCAALASALGSTFGITVLILAIPILRQAILLFGSPEFLMLTIWGLTTIALIARGSVIRALVAAGLGLMLAFIGSDPRTAELRYTFGFVFLWDGVGPIPALLGLYSIAEMIDLSASGRLTISGSHRLDELTGSVREGMAAVFEHFGLFVRSAMIGTLAGAIPGIGGTVASFLAYGQAVHTTRDRDKFGAGDIRGVIAPEAAHDAKDGSSLAPTMAFGIPANEATALLLAALVLHGLPPGRELMTSHLPLVFALIFALFLSNWITSIVGLAVASPLARATVVRVQLLVPIILAVSALAAFAFRQRFADICLAFVFGIAGYYMKKHGWPRIPLVIGLLLGKAFEMNLQITLQLRALGRLNPQAHPVGLVLVALTALNLILPIAQALRGRPSSPTVESVAKRSEERRVGKECTSWCRSRWSPYH